MKSSRHTGSLTVLIILFLGSVVLSGCASKVIRGRNFNPWLRTQLEIGKTGMADVGTIFGPPERIETTRVDSVEHHIAVYGRIGYERDPLIRVRRSEKKKYLYMDFKDSILCGYLYESSFPKDQCDFDQNDVTKIVEGVTRKSDMIAYFGQPHGVNRIPSAFLGRGTAGMENAIEWWSYRGSIEAPGQDEVMEKKLDVYLDSSGVVVKKSSTIPEAPPPPDLDRGFINFEDATPCDDYGTLKEIKIGDSLIVLPFLIELNNEGKVSGDFYPATQRSISKYIEYSLATRYTIVKPDSDKVNTTYLGDFALDILHRLDRIGENDTTQASDQSLFDVLKHFDSSGDIPLMWGRPVRSGTIPANTYLFLPFAIERESKYHRTARLYIFVVNSLGRVVFTRILSFDPQKWSGDISAFKHDIDGRLPLAD